MHRIKLYIAILALALLVAIGVIAAVSGYFLARALDASIAGSMATMTGVLFALALLFAPQQGLVPRWLARRRQQWQFAGEMLLVHLDFRLQSNSR